MVFLVHAVGQIMGVMPVFRLFGADTENAAGWAKNWSSRSWLLTDKMRESMSLSAAPKMRRLFFSCTPPLTFSPEQLRKVKTPLLLVLGDRDRLVGDPEKVRPLAENVPGIRIEVLPSAHLVGAERPDESNALIKEFLMR